LILILNVIHDVALGDHEAIFKISASEKSTVLGHFLELLQL
jgi:hypothetical protein